MALPTSAADAGVSGISLDQVISVAGLNPEDANFLKGRIDDSMRQQFLGMRTMREFEALAARFLFSAPGAPSPAKLMQLKNSLQEALQRADLLQDKTVVELAEGAATGAGGNAEAEVARKRLASELNSAGRASSSVPTVASSPPGLAETAAREVFDHSAEMDQAGIVGDKKRRLEGLAESLHGSSVKISDNTIEFHHLKKLMDHAASKFVLGPSSQTSSLRSALSIVRATESGKQQGKLPLAVLSSNCWAAADRVGCVIDFSRLYFAVEYATTYEDHSRIDSAPHLTSQRSYAGYYPLSCNMSPVARSTTANYSTLTAVFESGHDFVDDAATPSYSAHSVRITTAQSKYTKEFGQAVSQHLAHLKEAVHNREAIDDTEVSTLTKERAHTKLVAEKQESGFISCQGLLTRLVDCRERVRKTEAVIKQYRVEGAGTRAHNIRLEDPRAFGNDGTFREYKDEFGAAPDNTQMRCPSSATGMLSVYAGTEITDLYNLAHNGVTEDYLVLPAHNLADVESNILISYICRSTADLLWSYEISAAQTNAASLVGRHYEALADRTWPVYNSGVCVDMGFKYARIAALLGPNVERMRHSRGGTAPAHADVCDAPHRRRALWDVLDASGDHTDDSVGRLRLPLNGLVLTIENFIKMIENAIRILMVNKFQPTRLLELCVYEADVATEVLLAPMEVRVRGVGAGMDEDGDENTIEGLGTADTSHACFAVEWSLVPVTNFQYVNAGPPVLDPQRLTMALDVALNKFESYDRPIELDSRAAFRNQATLAAMGNLSMMKHFVHMGLLHERHIDYEMQDLVFHNVSELIPLAVCASHSLREVLADFGKMILKENGYSEFIKMVNVLHGLYGIKFNADEVGRVHCRPARAQWSMQVITAPVDAAMPARAADAPRERRAPLQLTQPRTVMEGPMGKLFHLPYAFDPRALSFLTNERQLLQCESKISDKLVIDDGFYKFARGREVEYISMPKVVKHLDMIPSCLQLDAATVVTNIAFMSQLCPLEDNDITHRCSFAKVEAQISKRGGDLNPTFERAPAGETWCYPLYKPAPDALATRVRIIYSPHRHLCSYLLREDKFVVLLLSGQGPQATAYRHLRSRLLTLKTKEGLEDTEAPAIYTLFKERLYLDKQAGGSDSVTTNIQAMKASSGLF